MILPHQDIEILLSSLILKITFLSFLIVYLFETNDPMYPFQSTNEINTIS